MAHAHQSTALRAATRGSVVDAVAFTLRRLVAHTTHVAVVVPAGEQVFEKEYGSNVAPLGSGYSMLQLTWAGEAFVVGPDGAPVPLDQPALAVLADKKVEWLVCRRARDLALLHREAILDVPMLAYCMALKDKGSGGLASGYTAAGAAGRANIVMEVATCDSLVDARALDSFVLRRIERGGATANGGHGTPPHPSSPHPATSPHHPAPSISGSLSSPTHHASRPPHLAPLHAPHSPNSSHPAPPSPGVDTTSIVELRLAELGTPKMIETVNYLRAIRDGHITVGLSRYLLHLPSLIAMLPSAAALRPKLCLHEELVRVALDLGDLTAAPRARTLAVTGSLNHGMLLNADDLEKVIPLLQVGQTRLGGGDRGSWEGGCAGVAGTAVGALWHL